MRIAAVGTAFPPHRYDQEELLAALKKAWGDKLFNLERLDRFHHNVAVGGRNLALPLERYAELTTWGAANDAWIEVAQDVGAAAVEDALNRAGLSSDDVDALIFVTVTGVATPSIDARLMNRLKLPSHVKRLPIFGLGCVAGAAGVARAADYVRAFPQHTAVLLSVELCSLTLQLQDFSVPNLISSGLFGDGAAAVVVVGEKREAAGPMIRATRSIFYPDSEGVMGWDVSEKGFQVVLSPDVPDVVRRFLGRDVDEFLSSHGLARDDVSSWVAHPGGPKVLTAIEETLNLPPDALAVTWKSLREVGNLSSTSVLLALEETMTNHRPPPGSLGLLFALGPGFCSELVLLEW
ncbi:MAG: type III polyketide synthase [Acidobacteriota bacterium]|nr:type III polyketide synthase [Acidobacteriota bacterium]